MVLQGLLAVASGDKPADLLLHNGRVINVFSGQIEETDIAVAGDRIAGIGPGYHAQQTIDLEGAFVGPALIDAHVHIESSLCVPPHFAASVVPRGVTTAIVDPHEIANVAGAAGIRYMADSSRNLPLSVVMMAPSSVPATPMHTSGAVLSADDLATLLADGTVYGLGEVMNYPAVVAGDGNLLAKIAAFHGRPIDGHAPDLKGMQLNAYAASGIGSEHECTTIDEAAEKLARGFYILIREATNAPNLRTLLPFVSTRNSRRICFCTDDRMPSDLLGHGAIDFMVREAVAFGIEPIEVLRMATLNTAECFGLRDRGAIAPGRLAEMVVFDDLNHFVARQVYARGKLVASEGELIDQVGSSVTILPDNIRNSVNIDWSAVDFRIPARGRKARVIGAQEYQLVTDERILEVSVDDGAAVAEPARDLLKIAVIERHTASGSMAVGFVQGLGLHSGAMAGTVAHDHHNLIVIGADDVSMMAAARAVGDMNGGLAVTLGDQILSAMALPIAGLMSSRPIATVCAAYDELLAAASAQGSHLHDPFMAMSFLGLDVIPKIKITDQGLIDVERFDFVDVFI